MNQTSIDEAAFWFDPARFDNDDFHGRPPYDVVAVVARILAAHPQPKRGLDVGCGPGRLSNLIASTNREMSVLGVDISTPALFRAAGEAPPNAHYWHGDGRTIPSGVTGTFDLVWSVTVFQHIPQGAMIEYVMQVRDRLRRDGVFVFTVACSDEPPGPFFYPMNDNDMDHLCSTLTEWFDLIYVDHDVVNNWTWLEVRK